MRDRKFIETKILLSVHYPIQIKYKYEKVMRPNLLDPSFILSYFKLKFSWSITEPLQGRFENS